MNSNIKTAIFWVVLILVAVLLWQVITRSSKPTERQISFSEFMHEVEAGKVKGVQIAGNEVHGDYADKNADFRTAVPNYSDVFRILLDKGVVVEYKQADSTNWTSTLVNALPFVLLLSFWIFMMRQMQSGGNKALSFGKSRARLHSSQLKKVTFEHVAGAEEAKEGLQEIIEFLREPQRFQKLGGRIPKGVLLVGPPGTGKTLLARAIAGEASVPFFSMSGSDFVEMFVGVGASRVRDLFEQGKKNAPCIIFIDEIDAVGRHRGAGLGGGHDEREQTLNQLLVEMDGFESNEGVILVAATNRPDVLDPALMRPGRFDRRIRVPLPTTTEREAILRVHTKKIPLGDNVDLRPLAQQTTGFAGADLGMVVNEAALLAASANRKVVMMVDFDLALGHVRQGIREKLSLDSKEDKWRVAVHEIGHLSASLSLPCLQNIQTVSLHSPYRADWFDNDPVALPEVVTSDAARGTLTVLLSGRAAEEILFKDTSSLCGADTAIATALARQMISSWGMNDKMGLANFDLIRNGPTFHISQPGTARILLEGDSHSREQIEVKKLLDDVYRVALRHVEANAQVIVDWSVKLLEQETFSASVIEQLSASSRFKSRLTSLSQAPPSKDKVESKGNVMSGQIGECFEQPLKEKTVDILKKHRNILQMQIAALGMNAPPHLVLQLEDVEQRIRATEKGEEAAAS